MVNSERQGHTLDSYDPHTVSELSAGHFLGHVLNWRIYESDRNFVTQPNADFSLQTFFTVRWQLEFADARIAAWCPSDD